MNNGQHPQDLDAPEARRPRLEIPSFMKDKGELETGIATIVASERPAASVVAEVPPATHMENMLADLAKLIRVPADVPAIGVDAALKTAKCFEIAAADVRAIAADRIRAANELQQEAESYANVLEQAGKVLAARVSAESARAYKLSLLLREAREVIAGPPAQDERET